MTSSYALLLTDRDELLHLHWGPRIGPADAEALAADPLPPSWPSSRRSTGTRSIPSRAAPGSSGPRASGS
ncbi:hypothetical protein ACIQMR_11145 [Streptomyces sp. NPDC091376]|uniref:hypothetical protein n=1 Tax=Streptomyces sp. NPDC091376 TaxID=3365994 RepID=UPI0038237950